MEIPKIISKQLIKDKKCGGCNNTTSTLYSFETNDINKHGICAYCFMDILVNGINK
jgi:hypothetical protein